MCGIFVGIGDQLEFHRNQIIDNGEINPNIKLEPYRACAEESSQESRCECFRSLAGSASFATMQPAFMTTSCGNQSGPPCSSEALGRCQLTPIAFNRCAPFPRVSAASLERSVPNLGTGQQLLSGCTNFNNNQVVAGPDLQSLTTAAIFTADDLGFTSNQVEAQTFGIVIPSREANLSFLINAFLLGRTLRAGDSRFKEPVARIDPDADPFNVMVSLLSLATRLNNTVTNQGDHCIFAFSAAGNERVRESLNQVLDSRPAARELCASIQKTLQRPVSAFLSAHLGIDAFNREILSARVLLLPNFRSISKRMFCGPRRPQLSLK